MRICILAFIIMLSSSPSFSQPLPVSGLPYSIPNDQFKPMRSLTDYAFQKRLEKRLNQKANWAKLIKEQKMAVGVVDLSDPNTIRFARVNGKTMIYAASLPKLAIMLAAVQGFEDNLPTRSKIST